jgi:hypothetical protein
LLIHSPAEGRVDLTVSTLTIKSGVREYPESA